jgi:hypothetical protein
MWLKFSQECWREPISKTSREKAASGAAWPDGEPPIPCAGYIRYPPRKLMVYLFNYPVF